MWALGRISLIHHHNMIRIIKPPNRIIIKVKCCHAYKILSTGQAASECSTNLDITFIFIINRILGGVGFKDSEKNWCIISHPIFSVNTNKCISWARLRLFLSTLPSNVPAAEVTAGTHCFTFNFTSFNGKTHTHTYSTCSINEEIIRLQKIDEHFTNIVLLCLK